MIIFFGTLYAVLILIVVIISFFIIFHIIRFSYNKAAKTAMLAIFILVAGLLLAGNIFLFSALPLQEIISQFIR